MEKRCQVQKTGLGSRKGFFAHLDITRFLYPTTGNNRVAVDIKTRDSVSDLFHCCYLLALLFRRLSGKDHGEAESGVRVHSDNHWSSRVPRQTHNAHLAAER